jgi:hypothetical protein
MNTFLLGTDYYEALWRFDRAENEGVSVSEKQALQGQTQ